MKYGKCGNMEKWIMHSFLLNSKNLNNSVVCRNIHSLSYSQICGLADLVCTVCVFMLKGHWLSGSRSSCGSSKWSRRTIQITHAQLKVYVLFTSASLLLSQASHMTMLKSNGVGDYATFSRRRYYKVTWKRALYVCNFYFHQGESCPCLMTSTKSWRKQDSP